jgi:O-glycosyl hydrolase
VYVTDKSANAVHFAIVTNVVVAIAKAAAWMSTGSATMLSEVFHSLADIGNQTLLSIGITRSKYSLREIPSDWTKAATHANSPVWICQRAIRLGSDQRGGHILRRRCLRCVQRHRSFHLAG